MTVSTEDKKLFRQTIGRVKRLRNDQVEFEKKRVKVKIHEPLSEVDLFSDMMSDDFNWLGEEADFEMRFYRSGIQKKLFRELVQGKIFPKAVIDLHGLTVSEARQELSLFLYYALKQNLYFIKIIHGQGYGSKNGPVIRGFVNKWLRLRDEILAFTNAPLKMGGKGATLCILRSYEFKEGRR